MASLIKCPACGADVSAAAPTCPKCGHPIAPQRPVVIQHKKQANSGCAIVLLVLLAAFIVALVKGTDSSDTSGSNASPAAPALSDSECKKFLRCIGEKLSDDVDIQIACKHAVDAQATNDSEWDDGVLSPILSKFSWSDPGKSDGNVNLIGDRVKFQNGFGNFIRMTYICTVDPGTRTVLSANVFQGKLPE